MAARCIILDIGGVLEYTPATGWNQRWERELGLPAGAVEQRLGKVWEAGAVGAVSESEVRAQVSRELGLGPARLDAFMADLWAEYLGSPNEELIAYVRGLRPRCSLGILSNSFVGAREREEAAYAFGELADEVVYSHEIGFNKPDRRAYEVACARLGVRARDCLFIDDVAAHVDAARDAGMEGELFVGNAQAMERIARHLG
jgi:putative hydrolase of the HAD superfamily